MDRVNCRDAILSMFDTIEVLIHVDDEILDLTNSEAMFALSNYLQAVDTLMVHLNE